MFTIYIMNGVTNQHGCAYTLGTPRNSAHCTSGGPIPILLLKQNNPNPNANPDRRK